VLLERAQQAGAIERVNAFQWWLCTKARQPVWFAVGLARQGKARTRHDDVARSSEDRSTSCSATLAGMAVLTRLDPNMRGTQTIGGVWISHLPLWLPAGCSGCHCAAASPVPTALA
jgi:hypothetical protein